MMTITDKCLRGGLILIALSFLAACNAALIEPAVATVGSAILREQRDKADKMRNLSDKDLCQGALAGYAIAWEVAPMMAGHVAEAKRRGYSPYICDDLSGNRQTREQQFKQDQERREYQKSIQRAEEERQRQEAARRAEEERQRALAALDDKTLCRKALQPSTIAWDLSPIFAEEVAESKRRGYTPNDCYALSGKKAEEELKKAEAARRAKEVLDRLAAERKRKELEEARRVEEERQRLQAARRVEEERQRLLAAREAERKRKAAEDARRAEEEKQRKEAERLAEAQPVYLGAGSGFAISKDGHFLTNHHVVKRCQLVVVHPPSGIQKSVVVASDIKNDLALLKTTLNNKEVLPLAGENASLLDDIVVAGYPFSLTLSSSVKLTKGVVSSLAGLKNDYSRFQIDAAIQPGNSGGPILNQTGNVVGVAVGALNKELFSEAENTNFGIKSSTARTFVEANNVTLPKPNSTPMTKGELVDLITNTTHLVSCWVPRSVARKMLEESEREDVAVSPTLQRQIEQLD